MENEILKIPNQKCSVEMKKKKHQLERDLENIEKDITYTRTKLRAFN